MTPPDDNITVPGTAPQEGGLAEAQLLAIEEAFAGHERMLSRLRRELEEMRERPANAEPARIESDTGLEERLSAIETRLDRQEQALRHVLQRLIEFFEGDEV